MSCNIHTHYMQYALRLASRHLGLTKDNPSVGCVIVKNTYVVGVGYTAVGGRPHAETQAIRMAGNKCQGAIAYVTLEPCAHVGNTPSCAKSLVQAGICECYIATTDVDNRTHGQGIKILQEAGIKVHVGLLQDTAHMHHMGFFYNKRLNRPMVTVKVACSMDGKIALKNGRSRWITNEKSRAYGHYLRATHDAILVGGETVRQDTPMLNCRLVGMEHTSPIRIILSHHLSKDSPCLKGTGETYVLSGDVESVLKKIAELGINRLLVEGGGQTITQFMQSGCVDRVAHFQAPKIIGDDGVSVIDGLNITNMIDIPTYKVLDRKLFDTDIFTLYGR